MVGLEDGGDGHSSSARSRTTRRSNRVNVRSDNMGAACSALRSMDDAGNAMEGDGRRAVPSLMSGLNLESSGAIGYWKSRFRVK